MAAKNTSQNNKMMMTLLKGRTFIVLIILMIFFGITADNFLSAGALLTVAKHVALYGILAIGMTYGKELKEAVEIGTRLAASVIITTDNVCPRFLPKELGLDIDVEE